MFWIPWVNLYRNPVDEIGPGWQGDAGSVIDCRSVGMEIGWLGIAIQFTICWHS